MAHGVRAAPHSHRWPLPRCLRDAQRHKKGLPKVFLFSKKTEPTALYNAMSAEFEGRLHLSIIGDQVRFF